MRYISRFHSAIFWMEFKSIKGRQDYIFFYLPGRMIIAVMRLPRAEKDLFLASTFKTKWPPCSEGRRELMSGWACTDTHESSLILKVQHQPSRAGRTKSNLKKSFQHIKPTSRYLYCGGGDRYHIYWLCFHFPLGKPSVMRKEMEEDCFSPSALSTQLILLGGQISAVPGEGKRKMSQINQEQNDWWPVSAANNTRLLIIQLQMEAGAPRMTSIHAAGSILDVSPWMRREMEHTVFSRGAYLPGL